MVMMEPCRVAELSQQANDTKWTVLHDMAGPVESFWVFKLFRVTTYLFKAMSLFQNVKVKLKVLVIIKFVWF